MPALHGDGLVGVEVSEGGLEEREAVGCFMPAGEERMVERVCDAFGMRHETEDAAGDVADAGDGFGGAVGVGIDILECDLVVGFEGGEDFRRASDESPFAVSDGQIERWAVFRNPFAEPGDWLDASPAVFEFSGGVVGQRGGVPIGGVELRNRAGEQAGLDEDLEAVADADDEFAVVDELLERGFEMVDELVGEYFSGGDVVAVGESAGEGEDLVLLKGGWVGEQGVDVEGIDGNVIAASKFESVSEFAVAVGAGGA